MSAKVKAIKNLYKHGKLSKAQIHASVPDVLTAEEYALIVGEAYE